MNQMASFQVPDARMAVITPVDKTALRAIESAIRDSDLGVNPSNDGAIIRVVFPQLTEERRSEYIKVAKAKGEDAKISIRNVRRKPRRPWTSWSRTARPARTRCAARRRSSTTLTAEVRRPDRRAAQAQGSRAAGGLSPERGSHLPGRRSDVHCGPAAMIAAGPQRFLTRFRERDGGDPQQTQPRGASRGWYGRMASTQTRRGEAQAPGEGPGGGGGAGRSGARRARSRRPGGRGGPGGYGGPGGPGGPGSPGPGGPGPGGPAAAPAAPAAADPDTPGPVRAARAAATPAARATPRASPPAGPAATCRPPSASAWAWPRCCSAPCSCAARSR